MILSKEYYIRVSFFKRLWIKRQISKLSKSSKLFTQGSWKNYHLTDRARIVPKFIGTKKDLMGINDPKKLEAICPTGALEVTTNTILIDEKNCIGCQECVKASPEGFFATNQERLPSDPETN